MNDRPYVLVKCAMSLDGFLDDSSDQRLLLSSPEDSARVDEQRAAVDAILVGATTIRADNPRLMVRSPKLRQQRIMRGLPESPKKVTVTRSGDLDPSLPFFTTGDCEKIVYVSDDAADKARRILGSVATVVACGDPVSLPALLADLYSRGIGRLMVEGGSSIHTQFLTQGLVDEIQAAIAPFFVGDSSAPRFVTDGKFPFGPGRRMILADIERYGDCAYLRYRLTEQPSE
ncbi:RibD family protein [Catellatospora citrea]|uniref:Bacterial bifunctional deaminase-reductase C-terminal domain-containing protein n=1 Tax=Catellatospora citrea TaxID=53366 RepID=A0A8J3KFQ0_9ACTN|nr:RibD family protein [Catellatospora citrea]RKE07911.1 5-amino-6-(5-phosphoribosylamino)uracil reductase [Catellatospora citrea]GIG02078.1 hypothetical protein Cci01nite_71710 [Catellatospora citrea]